jgi:hypothetical protein
VPAGGGNGRIDRRLKNAESWAAFFMGAASGFAAHFFSRAERRQPEGVLSLAGEYLLWRAS